MTLKVYKSKLILAVLLLFILVVTAACGDSPAETTENTTTVPVVTTAPITTSLVSTTMPTTTTPITTETPTTPEDPDAWKEKVEWRGKDSWYDSETDEYYICINVQDVFNIGQENADAAFAEDFGLEYDLNLYKYYECHPFVMWVSMEEIEALAKREDVKSIYFMMRAENL